jgi:hypothetical protein
MRMTPRYLPFAFDHPDAARTGHVDVPVLVALHAVDNTLVVVAGADAFGEDAAAAQRPVGCEVERTDVRTRRVVHVENLLVGRQAQPVRLVEVILFAVQRANA